MNQLSNDDDLPKKLCDDCTTELVMVAKFHEKCEMSAAALDQIRRQIDRQSKSKDNLSTYQHTETDSNADTFYEHLEYTEDNVEYVIYDASADLIEENDDQDKSQDQIQSDVIEVDCEVEQTTYEINRTQVC